MGEHNSNLADVNVLLGVSGGIAAYKVVDLASKLIVAGANVQTIMTENACRLVGAKTFEAVTQSAVFTSLWDISQKYEVSHVSLADWADIVVVAPATANIIGKAAGGICDCLLSTTLCVCWDRPVLVAPAMNEHMWMNKIVQRNVKVLKDIGFEFIGPTTGRLVCGTEGIGRMSEPQDILEAIIKTASETKDK